MERGEVPCRCLPGHQVALNMPMLAFHTFHPPGALLATKGRVAELSAVEQLYRSARDELGRLDKVQLGAGVHKS